MKRQRCHPCLDRLPPRHLPEASSTPTSPVTRDADSDNPARPHRIRTHAALSGHPAAPRRFEGPDGPHLSTSCSRSDWDSPAIAGPSSPCAAVVLPPAPPPAAASLAWALRYCDSMMVKMKLCGGSRIRRPWRGAAGARAGGRSERRMRGARDGASARKFAEIAPAKQRALHRPSNRTGAVMRAGIIGSPLRAR